MVGYSGAESKQMGERIPFGTLRLTKYEFVKYRRIYSTLENEGHQQNMIKLKGVFYC